MSFQLLEIIVGVKSEPKEIYLDNALPQLKLGPDMGAYIKIKTDQIVPTITISEDEIYVTSNDIEPPRLLRTFSLSNEPQVNFNPLHGEKAFGVSVYSDSQFNFIQV